MDEISGWLLDLYEDPQRGVALWIITDDDRRVCVFQELAVKFYVAGPDDRLRELWRWLKGEPDPPKLGREERRDLFLPAPIPVLAVEVKRPSEISPLFRRTEQAFPDLVYYDVDVQVQTRHAAAFGTFPLARCRLVVDAGRNIHEIDILDSPWDIDPEPPPLRVMEIGLDCNPRHAPPKYMEVSYLSARARWSLLAGNVPATGLKWLLNRYDPDVIVTDYGDTWLLEELLGRVDHDPEKLPLSRDPKRSINIIKARTYFSYGQIVYRGEQVHLYGRIHIDRKNGMMWGDYGLEGALENARVTALPIQTAARVSPGSGISCMEMITALRTGVLVPWHKQQAEKPRPALDLIHADFGGLVYQPVVGLHFDVGAIDFVSLYPAVIVRCDISPEKTPISLSDPPVENPGLIPQTLAPLLHKRITLKQKLMELPAWDPRRKSYKAQASAQKWLLVVSFGFLGYKNARFGRIEAHEAVTCGGREALLCAKEAAEDAGFEVLHMFVDGLWIKREGCDTSQGFQGLLEEITRRTGLPIALDSIYRWVAFLPSRLDERVPVGNRYFGVFQDGSIKVRGIEARRRDTPSWIGDVQMKVKHSGCLEVAFGNAP